jgi:hypothetical protein
MKLAVFTASIFVVCLLTPALRAQTKIRTVQDAKGFANQPLKVVSKSLGEHKFIEEKVEGGPNWLLDLSIEVKNVSDKKINYAYCLLLVEKQADMPASYALPLIYENHAQPIAPGGVATLKVLDSQLVQAMKYVAKYGGTDVDKIVLTIQRVHFDDDTRWITGKDMKRDPLDKNSWVRIEQTNPRPFF